MSYLSSCIHVNSDQLGEISCIIALSDGKIVTAFGNKENSIWITAIDLKTNNYKIGITIRKAHSSLITTLCEFNHGTLCSGSFQKIKFWQISSESVKLKVVIRAHSENVNKILLINNKKKWISCSDDRTMKIWNNIAPYKEDKQLKQTDKYPINSLIELQKKNLIVTSSYDGVNNGYLFFYDSNSFSKISLMENCYTVHSNGMIELSNGCIALSQQKHILIINTFSFNIAAYIYDNSFSYGRFSLSVLDQHSFISVTHGQVIRISTLNNSYNIINKEQMEWEDLIGETGIIVMDEYSNGNKFILSSNNDNGFSVIKYEYQQIKNNI